MVTYRLLLAIAFWMVCYAPALAQMQSIADAVRPVQFTMSDTLAVSASASDEFSEEYPDYVSKDPGFPRKPMWQRPGDFNGSDCMMPRYCQDDCFRAGWPGTLRKHSATSWNSHYSAWYVGGGAGLPFLSNRHRTAAEGTWGLDYSLWKKPRTVWMKWTCGRRQGGEGAYETDHEPHNWLFQNPLR